MNHILDNPVWNALISGNKHLCLGDEQLKYFDKAVSPFVAFEQFSPEKLDVLYDRLPANTIGTVVTPMEIDIPGKWKITRLMKGLQMVHEADVVSNVSDTNLIPLTGEHVPQMLALTGLTKPGPFESGTIKFGHYQGIFDRDELVAMAGQRLNPFNYAEVSAVCTHPDYLGKGYARQLLIYQINRIKGAGNIPFLHVRGDNERAINVYKSIGFTERTGMNFYYLVKAE